MTCGDVSFHFFQKIAFLGVPFFGIFRGVSKEAGSVPFLYDHKGNTWKLKLLQLDTRVFFSLPA